MIDFGKADHIAAAAAAVAVEQALAGIYQEAGFAIGVQGTQPHPSTAAEWPDRLPILSPQIIQQRNLLFQFVESLATHGLLASIGRIRHSAPRSQARMVVVCKKCKSGGPACTQNHTLSSRRCTHRRKVDGSGRWSGL